MWSRSLRPLPRRYAVLETPGPPGCAKTVPAKGGVGGGHGGGELGVLRVEGEEEPRAEVGGVAGVVFEVGGGGDGVPVKGGGGLWLGAG